MQILDASGNKIQLRQIDFVRTEAVINGVEHVGFHIRGTNNGEILPKADLDEKTEQEIMERLTEEYDYLGEPIR
jgi:hypothetical protein